MGAAKDPARDGALWAALGFPLVQALRFVTKIVLAALFVPEGLGPVFSAALLAFAFQQIASLGVDVRIGCAVRLSLEQIRGVRGQLRRAGLLFGGLQALFAAALFSLDPRLAIALLWLAPRFILLQDAAVDTARLVRDQAQRTLLLRDLAGAVAFICGTVVGAAFGLNAEALLVGWYAEALAVLIVVRRNSWSRSESTLRSEPQAAAEARALSSRTGWTIGLAQLFAYLGERAEALVILAFLGTRALALHDVASHLALFLFSYASQFAERWLLPRIASGQPRAQGWIRRAQHFLLVWLIPAQVLLAMTATSWAALLFNPAWQDLPPILAMLSLCALMRALSIVPRAALLARGASRLALRLTGIESVAVVIVCMALSEGGLLSVLWGVLCVRCLGAFLWNFAFRRQRLLALTHESRRGRRAIVGLALWAMALLSLREFEVVQSPGVVGIVFYSVAFGAWFGMRLWIERRYTLFEWRALRSVWGGRAVGGSR